MVERGIHWRRFRWADHVEHHGQGTLRVVLQRRETAHPLYRFADEQSRRNPRWASAAAEERRLRRDLEAFLVERGCRPLRRPWRRGSGPLADDSDAPALPVRRRARWDRLPFPASRVVRIAAGFGLGQPQSELRRLFRLVRRRRPRTVLELGRSAGGTFFLWTRAAAARATLVSAGPPPWEPDDPGEEFRRRVMITFGRPRQSLHVLRDDPLTASARARVDALLAGRGLDFLFLSGEDDVERIRGALDLYAPLVRSGGLVALDGVRQRIGGNDRLPRFWSEVEDRARRGCWKRTRGGRVRDRRRAHRAKDPAEWWRP